MPFRAEKAMELLAKAKVGNRLGHAYMITGPKEADREGFATAFFNLASGAKWKSLDEWQQHAVHIVRPESKSRRVTTDAIRELERGLNMSSGPEGHKFGVIIDAERMMAQAQNAFLKTLEEPPPRTLLLLLTAQPQQLLPTILSRVIEIPLLAPDTARVFSEHEQKLLAVLEKLCSRPTSSLSGAFALKKEFEEILEELHESIKEEMEEDFEREREHYAKTTEGNWLKHREEQVEANIESAYLMQRDALMDLLLSWMGDVVRQQVGAEHLDLRQYQPATAALAQRWTPAEAGKRLRVLRKLEQHLHTNVNEGLALEVSFVSAFG
jgi:DNA polymerase III subunit delta'